eukprot:m.21728 g.21728  ORF g.21728 m.21728 type:complete len:179 (+) comp3660_c0_seq1:40-576(+)
MAAPSVQAHEFDALESQIKEIVNGNKDEVNKWWAALDVNGNGIVSLAEVDRWIVIAFPLLDHKPALMRAFVCTTKREGDGDDWVERHEFITLIRNIFYFNRVFKVFDDIDKNDDRRLTLEEFTKGLPHLGLHLSAAEAKATFNEIDSNHGGFILFDEFCQWIANKHCPVGGISSKSSK